MPDIEILLKILEDHKKTKQWQDIQYIPMPTTWINRHRWEDEIDQPIQPDQKQIQKPRTYLEEVAYEEAQSRKYQQEEE
jgi:hypothetical protein